MAALSPLSFSGPSIAAAAVARRTLSSPQYTRADLSVPELDCVSSSHLATSPNSAAASPDFNAMFINNTASDLCNNKTLAAPVTPPVSPVCAPPATPRMEANRVNRRNERLARAIAAEEKEMFGNNFLVDAEYEVTPYFPDVLSPAPFLPAFNMALLALAGDASVSAFSAPLVSE